MSLEFINLFKNLEEKPKSLFLDEPMGLMENIYITHEKVWNNYKLMKSLDWSEDEVDISPCLAEFKNPIVPHEIKDLMIKTLSWQFEADSVATNIYRLVSPFINNTELNAYLLRVADNECLHSLAYSFIVRNSFEDPTTVLKELLSIKESFIRLDKVHKVFTDIYNIGLKYQLGEITDRTEIMQYIFKFFVALLALERIQFISSFYITFSIAEQGYFTQIASLVSKIAVDEFQVHVQGDKDILANELNVEENFEAYLNVVDELNEIITEVTNSELNWVEFLFKDKESICGIYKKNLIDFIYYSATEVYSFLNISSSFPIITKNPSPFMNKWLNINSSQKSPQEESVTNYLLGRFVDNSNEFNVKDLSAR